MIILKSVLGVSLQNANNLEDELSTEKIIITLKVENLKSKINHVKNSSKLNSPPVLHPEHRRANACHGADGSVRRTRSRVLSAAGDFRCLRACVFVSSGGWGRWRCITKRLYGIMLTDTGLLNFAYAC
jgi:hypothetical protein